MNLEYAVVFERTPNNYAAYAPDVPGCGSTGRTLEDAQTNIREALAFHIEGLLERDEPLPDARTSLADAMKRHLKVLAECGEIPSLQDATVDMIELQIEDAQALARQ